MLSCLVVSYTHLKFTKSCKKGGKNFINHQIKKCLLFRCRHAVVIMQILNWTNQCPLFMTVRHTLDSANAFVSPGVNSRGELVPSHGASRRRLGDKKREIQARVSLSIFTLKIISNMSLCYSKATHKRK
jgi:hypothetical protein